MRFFIARDIVLGGTLTNTLQSLQGTQSLIDQTTQRLATGLKVNRALDNPTNFFQARALDNRADDLDRLLDGIAQGIRTIEEAGNGVDALLDILALAENSAENSRDIMTQATDLRDLILEEEPLIYSPFDDTSGTTPTNLGSLTDSTLVYRNGVLLEQDPLYFEAGASAYFDGISDAVSISSPVNDSPDGYAQRTIEFVFQAETTAGRQILYEQGGPPTGLAVYIDNGELYFNYRNSGDATTSFFSVEIEANQSYHVTTVYDAVDGTFRGYVNGEIVGTAAVTRSIPSFGGSSFIGGSSSSAFFHDGPAFGVSFFFQGRMSDFALYDNALTQDRIQAHADSTFITAKEPLEQELEDILSQVTLIAQDANYRGLALLQGDDLRIFFNADRTSFIDVEGQNFTAADFGLGAIDFSTLDSLNRAIDNISNGVDQLRSFGSTLSSNLNVVATREIFIQNQIETARAGADDLTVADQNEEGANLLALSTRQQIALSVMSIASQQFSSVLSLFP